MKTALIIGATGLIGKQLTLKLLEDKRYDLVKIFVRRSPEISNRKLEEHIINFAKIELWKDKIIGDELYSAMGTTIRKTRSKEKQYNIDVTFQYEFAKVAAENGVAGYCLVSSAGANILSKVFYLRIKGVLEEMVKQLSFKKIIIFRPSLLLGEREEKRFGEKAAERILKFIIPFIPSLKKHRPIEGKIVADAMINAMNTDKDKFRIYELDEIFRSAG